MTEDRQDVPTVTFVGGPGVPNGEYVPLSILEEEVRRRETAEAEREFHAGRYKEQHLTVHKLEDTIVALRERAEAAEVEAAQWRGAFEGLAAREQELLAEIEDVRAAAEAEVEMLRGALGYLADPESWHGNPEAHDAMLFGHDTPFELARAALSPSQEPKG